VKTEPALLAQKVVGHPDSEEQQPRFVPHRGANDPREAFRGGGGTYCPERDGPDWANDGTGGGHCAASVFDGEDPSLRDGLAAAWGVRRRIAVWAVVAATLGTGLYILDEKFGAFGSLAGLVFDLTWALLTYFIVPGIVLGRADGIRRQLRRSGSLFKNTWGESVSASLGVSFVFFVVALPGLALLGAGYFVLHGTLALAALVGGGLIVVAAIVGSQTVTAIVRTALYRYATEGARVGPFAARDPDTVFPES